MKLYVLTQNKNTAKDTYNMLVVSAPSKQAAQKIIPGGLMPGFHPNLLDWCAPEFVTLEYIGKAAAHIEGGVICASFNAG